MLDVSSRGEHTAGRAGNAGLRRITAEDIATGIPFSVAVDALEKVLLAGLDPEEDQVRSRISTAAGELLIMPSAALDFSGIKVLSNTPENPGRGHPLLQGEFLLFDAPEQRPVALIDGVGLTNLRTPAVSALALRHLAPGPSGPENLTIFGSGTQARMHAAALCELRDIGKVTFVGRNRASLEVATAELRSRGVDARAVDSATAADAVRGADIVCTCTSSADPLFDGQLVKDSAVVVAVGSHSPSSREVDDHLVRRSSVVIESRASVLREGGDIMIPLASGALSDADLLLLRDVVVGGAGPQPAAGPICFKFSGMPWEDLAVAVAVYGWIGRRG